MKKQIKGSCILTAKLFSQWANFHLFKSTYPRLKKACVYSAITMVGGGMIYLGASTGKTILIIAGVAVLLGLFVFSYSVKSVVNKQLSSADGILKDPYEFVLAPTGIIVTIKHGDGEERLDNFYNEIEKVYDYNGCFYVYIRKGSCYIIPIGCLNASPAECRAFMADKMGNKYIMCK